MRATWAAGGNFTPNEKRGAAAAPRLPSNPGFQLKNLPAPVSASTPAIPPISAVTPAASSAATATTAASASATATTTAVTSASATTSWPAASAATTTFARRTSFIDDDVAAHEVMPVQALDGALGFFVAVDFHKSESTRLPRKTVAHQRNIRRGDSRL